MSAVRNTNQSINSFPKSNNYDSSPVRRNLSNEAASPVLIEDFDNDCDNETPHNNDADNIVGGFSINSPSVDSFVSLIDRESTNEYNERQSSSKFYILLIVLSKINLISRKCKEDFKILVKKI